MSKREIVQLGNEVLRQTAKIVDDIGSSEIQQVIKDLLCTLEGTSGV
jgi:peptide deformylase